MRHKETYPKLTSWFMTGPGQGSRPFDSHWRVFIPPSLHLLLLRARLLKYKSWEPSPDNLSARGVSVLTWTNYPHGENEVDKNRQKLSPKAVCGGLVLFVQPAWQANFILIQQNPVLLPSSRSFPRVHHLHIPRFLIPWHLRWSGINSETNGRSLH